MDIAPGSERPDRGEIGTRAVLQGPASGYGLECPGGAPGAGSGGLSGRGETQVGCIWQSEHVTGLAAATAGAQRGFSPRHRKPSRWNRIADYFQRKCTNSRPKFFESFSTR